MDTIPLETKVNFFSYLSLKELQNFSYCCKQLRREVTSEIVIKDALKNHDLTTLTLSFISEFSSLMTTEQMMKLDFKEKITHKKLWQIAETATNVTSLRKLKLIASLYLYKKEVDDWGATYDPSNWLNAKGIEIHKQQLSYYYLISLSGKRIIENLTLEVEKNNSELAASFVTLKTAQELMEFYDSCEAENTNPKEKTTTMMTLDYCILKVHNRLGIVEILTALWQQHPIKNFSPQNDQREYVPSEVFEGFCNAIKSRQNQDGTYSLEDVSSLILAEEQLQAFLTILPGLKFDSLSISLSADIKPKTMQSLADALCSDNFVNQNSDGHLDLELGSWQYKKETSEMTTDEEKAESRKIFEKMAECLSTLSPSWFGKALNW